ncbi:MAG TPA: sulfur reduction protein DsrE, partial [Syntrophomonas wolfei]|nr:sulfur reduction protein DsrE [Syntrophomonas wolfei]
MKIAYVFSSTTSQKILNTMIIPQLEKGTHGVDVV